MKTISNEQKAKQTYPYYEDMNDIELVQANAHRIGFIAGCEWKDEQRKEDFKRLRAHYQAWADEQINEHRAMLANQNEPNSELFKQWDKATDENIKLRKIIKELVEEAYDIVKNLPENDERLARFKINNILIENHI